MVLIPPTLLVGLLVGRLLGGRVRHLADARVEAVWLVFAAVALQLSLAALEALGGPAGELALPLLLASQAALLAFLWRNRHLPGVGLAALGLLANAVVIAANGGMPVSREALLAVGASPEEVVPGKHRLAGEGDVLLPLADVLPVPVLRTVVSVGDIVLAGGVGLMVVQLMQRGAQPAHADDVHGFRRSTAVPAPEDWRAD